MKRQREEDRGQQKGSESSPDLLQTVLQAKVALEVHSSSTSEALLLAISQLKDLGQLPTEVLRGTQIGRLANQVAREVESDEVRENLKELLSEWKRLFKASRGGAGFAKRVATEEVHAGEHGPKDMPSHTSPASASEQLTLALYRKRLAEQSKYFDSKPGTRSVDNCLQDPPTLPPTVTIDPKPEPRPARGDDGHFVFPDFPEFKPNLSPKQVLQSGSFGGTYFRDISSAVTGLHYKGIQVIKEFPDDWFEGLCLKDQVISQDYHKSVNKYLVACGGSLGMWETSGWISAIDPYGWFQWYCRFLLGRRSSDDERQVDRWLKGQGPKGRWRVQLMNKVIKERAKFDDAKVSPVIRQVLLHWAYELTVADFDAYREAKLKTK
jgi:hypothetical protein